MATIRAYTTIKQSKKLAEILSIESADMCYILHASSNNPEWRFDNDIPPMVLSKTPINKLTTNALPCWSLAVLLNIIPKHIKEYNTLRIDIGEKDFSIWYDEIGYGVNTELPNITTESTVDACYEMIVKLHKMNLL